MTDGRARRSRGATSGEGASPFRALLAAALGRAGAKASPPPGIDGQAAGRALRAPLGRLGHPHEPVAGAESPLASSAELARLAEREQGRVVEDEDRRARDALDPSARRAAQLAPPIFSPPPAPVAAPPAAAAEPAARRMSMEELMPALVRKIAWAGDKHRGTVRLEIGAGAYEGATLLVHADHGRVRVEVSGGAEADRLRERLGERLRRHGLDVESVT